jgi:hypothetical protein
MLHPYLVFETIRDHALGIVRITKDLPPRQPGLDASAKETSTRPTTCARN